MAVAAALAVLATWLAGLIIYVAVRDLWRGLAYTCRRRQSRNRDRQKELTRE